MNEMLSVRESHDSTHKNYKRAAVGFWSAECLSWDIWYSENRFSGDGVVRRMLGYEEDKKFAQGINSLANCVAAEDIQRLRDAFAACLMGEARGCAVNEEIQLRTRNGKARWHLITGKPSNKNGDGVHRIQGCLLDIHGWKEAEFLTTRYRLIAQAMTEGLWDMDVVAEDPVNPNNYFWWSPQFRAALGFEDETDFPNRLGSWSGRLHPEDFNRTMEDLNRHLKDTTDQTPYSIDYRLQMKNGEYRWFHAAGFTVRNQNGNPLRVAGTLRDIEHEVRQREAAREKLQRYSEIVGMLTQRNDLQNSLLYVSPEMDKLVKRIEKYGKTDALVLITGESGTGKEVVSDLIQKFSDRISQPFFKINCGAIPEHLLESELFGYEEGAFSGASKGGKVGFFELADNGTVLLDEIGDLPLPLQVKLLRFLQTRDFYRVGGKKLIKVNTRILAATHRNLEEMVQQKLFREDLFYRLQVMTIQIPALRERPEDIVPLTRHFLKRCNEKYHTAKVFTPEVYALFTRYMWKGNVRELENLIEKLVLVTEGELIDAEGLPEAMKNSVKNSLAGAPGVFLSYKEAKEAFERQYFQQAISTYGTARRVAEKAGLDHSTIVKKATKYEVGLSGWGRK